MITDILQNRQLDGNEKDNKIKELGANAFNTVFDFVEHMCLGHKTVGFDFIDLISQETFWSISFQKNKEQIERMVNDMKKIDSQTPTGNGDFKNLYKNMKEKFENRFTYSASNSTIIFTLKH